MKKVDEILGIKPKKKPFLTKSVKKWLLKCSIEAHEIDKSRSVSEFYTMFFKRLQKSYHDSKDKEEFFRKNIIEN